MVVSADELMAVRQLDSEKVPDSLHEWGVSDADDRLAFVVRNHVEWVVDLVNSEVLSVHRVIDQ